MSLDHHATIGVIWVLGVAELLQMARLESMLVAAVGVMALTVVCAFAVVGEAML